MIVLLAVSTAGMAAVTDATCDVTTDGSSTTYTYLFTSGEAFDEITSFHVYTPFDFGLITDWTTDRDWIFTAGPDPDLPGGTDIYWSAPDPDMYGLPYGEYLTVSITTLSVYPTSYDYQIPGLLGNWGYDTAMFQGWVTVMISSVPVPMPMPTAAPEPLGLAVLAAGCAMLLRFARRK
jgi:hypothetical protein